ncbi:MAG: hypothetical protein ACOCYQ_01025 [Alkalispirochaeta sp.]
MIDLKFRLRRDPAGPVILEFGIAFRILFAALALVLGTGVASAGAPTVLSLVVLAVLILGAVYEERWIIDPVKREVTNRQGLLFLARRRRWSFDDIQSVEYTHYRGGTLPGSPQTPPSNSAESAARDATSRFGGVSRGLDRYFLRYGIVTNAGQTVRIELRKVSDWNREKEIPGAVAAAIGVPLEHVTM